MSKYYNVGTHILTTGQELISKHIEYICNMICHHHAPKLVNLITFNENKPDGFGSSHGSSKSMSINLEEHFKHALTQSKENSQYSVRGLLIIELINTCHHELKHIMLKDDLLIISDNDDQKQEDAADEFANSEYWDTAKYINLEVVELGPILDGLLAKFITELKDAQTAGSMTDWQEQQLYMVENGIIYNDTRKHTIIKSMFDFCHYFSKNKESWDRSTIPVFEDTESWGDGDHESLEEALNRSEAVDTLVDNNVADMNHETPHPVVTDSIVDDWKGAVETPAPPIDNGPAIMHEDDDILMGMSMGDNVYDDTGSMEPMGDDNTYHDMSDADSDVNISSFDTTTTTSEPAAQPAPVTPVPSASVGDATHQSLKDITKIVCHRLFQNIYSKCEWDGEGKFLNAGAVLDPVNIADIAGADKLFTHMDILDANGAFKPKQPVSGFLKGTVSAQGLPMYKMYLTVNGMEHKRTFIPQNPQKTGPNGLTAWAKKVQAGHRLAMLLKDNGGPSLYLETTPGQSIGLEKCEECNWGSR